MDLVELAPIRQAQPAGQQPLLRATAAVQRAGSFLNCGDFESGLTVVDRAIVTAEAALLGPEKAFATGSLHLRGMTLAGRLGDRNEAQRHIHAAWTAAEEFPADALIHSERFCRWSSLLLVHVLGRVGGAYFEGRDSEYERDGVYRDEQPPGHHDAAPDNQDRRDRLDKLREDMQLSAPFTDRPVQGTRAHDCGDH